MAVPHKINLAQRKNRMQKKVAIMQRELEKPLVQALTRLGSTTQKIRIKLVNLQFTGHPGAADRCPIANYLRSKFSDSVSVKAHSILVDGVTVNTTEAVKEFIRKFDNREYPELEG
jgi:hypothetical protein